jgi:hypothetical protein
MFHLIFQATPIATTPIQDLPAFPREFFARPAEQIAPELIGCLQVKRQPSNMLTIEGLAIQVAWTCLLVYIV